MATSRSPDTLALVVDSNVTSRSLLSAQLRDYGVTKVVQCSRIQDARSRLEHTIFDYVLCDQYFPDSQSSGQTLLDDLRRAQLLPFSTVFFMVTTEATYAAVAEAAESALDGYLLKPFTPLTLFERLSAARQRKTHLRPSSTPSNRATSRPLPSCALPSSPGASPTGCMPRALARSCCCGWAATRRRACCSRPSSRPAPFPGPNWAWPAHRSRQATRHAPWPH
jgi:CheY-like chemotaxis protein